MFVGFDPIKRKGQNWEHWPIWSHVPTQNIPGVYADKPRYLREFRAQTVSPDNEICEVADRRFDRTEKMIRTVIRDRIYVVQTKHSLALSRRL